MFKVQNDKKNKNANQSGMVAVEVILSLVFFSVAMLGLVNFINIYMVHNRVQYAINCTANEIAAYSYLYSALGIRGAEQTLQNDFGGAAQMDDDAIMGVVDSYNKMNELLGTVNTTANDIQNIDVSIDGFEGLVDDINTLKDEGQATLDSFMDTKEKVIACFQDPKQTLAGFLYLMANGGINAGKGLIGEALAGSLTREFLNNGSQDADEYLKAYGVTDGYAGLDFTGSSVFNGPDKNMIDIEVRYEIEIGFLGLLIADPKLTVVQRVTVPAWLSGDDNKVSDHIKTDENK